MDHFSPWFLFIALLHCLFATTTDVLRAGLARKIDFLSPTQARVYFFCGGGKRKLWIVERVRKKGLLEAGGQKRLALEERSNSQHAY